MTADRKVLGAFPEQALAKEALSNHQLNPDLTDPTAAPVVPQRQLDREMDVRLLMSRLDLCGLTSFQPWMDRIRPRPAS